MQSLEKRVSLLEGARAVVNLKTMTDAELSAYAGTCEYGSKEMYVALVMLVNRHRSTIPVIVDDPDYVITNEKFRTMSLAKLSSADLDNRLTSCE